MSDFQSAEPIEQLQRRIADLELLTARCAHDLQGPLATIGGFLKGLPASAKAGRWEDFHADLERIARLVDHQRRTLSDVMQWLRHDEHHESVAQQPLRIPDLVRTASERLAGQMAERGVVIHVAEHLPTILGEDSALVSVWQNLLENAIRATPVTESPRIEIGCRRDSGETVFEARDYGTGIRPEDRERVFEPFVRLASQQSGSGLGLFLVRQIIIRHGGRVWIEPPAEGPGTIFCFTLPGTDPT